MIRQIWNAIVFGSLTTFWSAVALAVVPFNPRSRLAPRIARRWGKMVLPLCGIELEVRGPKSPLEAPAYLVMANHTSHFDVVAAYAGLPVDMRPVAKRELGYIPIFGWVLVLGAAIMIDRSDRRSAFASLERAGEVIRAGRSVLMFPEGTRTPPGVLMPLKRGPFHLAMAARVPVLPVGIRGTGDVLLPGDWRINPGKVVVTVGEPIETAHLPDTPEAREALAAQVQASLARLMESEATPGPQGAGR